MASDLLCEQSKIAVDTVLLVVIIPQILGRAGL